jgi:hypothetical protein
MALEETTLFVAQQDDAPEKYNVTYQQLRNAILAGTGKPTISPTRPEPASSSEGDFWWNDQTGELYIFYVDPSGDRYWVTASPAGQPNAGFVSVSTLPPTSPQEGALWWKDDDGILYVYYTDPSGDQYWVDTNPMGTPVGSAHTYVQDTAPDANSSTMGDFWFDSNTGVMYVYYTDATSSQWVASTGFNGYGEAAAVFDFPFGVDVVVGTEYTPVGSSITYVWNGQGWAIKGTGGGLQTLPIATATELGGIKVGSGLTINATTGVLDSVGNYTLPPATTSTLGGLIVGTGLSVTADGTTSTAVATSSSIGAVSVSTGLSVDGAGALSIDTAVVPRLGEANTFTATNIFSNITVNGAVTGALAGNATTATELATARTLWGQQFDGSSNVTGQLTDVTSITGVDLTLNGTTSIQLRPDSDTGLELYNGDHSVKTSFDTSGVTTNNTITIPAGSGILAYTTSQVASAQKIVRTATSINTDESYRLELGAPNNNTGALNTFVVSDGTRLTYNPKTNTLGNVGTINATVEVDAPTGTFTTLSDGTNSETVTNIINAASPGAVQTWTAQLEGTSSPSTKITAVGVYVKNGNTITASVDFDDVNTTSYSGQFSISGLPEANNANVSSCGSVHNFGMIDTSLNDGLTAIIPPGLQLIRIKGQEVNTFADWDGSQGAGRSMNVTVTYIL